MNDDQNQSSQPPAEPNPYQPLQQTQYQPQQPYYPQYNNHQQYAYPPVQPKRSKLKFVLLVIGLVVLLSGAGGSYYAFAYLPNTPENVWRRGLASIGVGLDELSQKGMLQASAASEMEGNITVTKPTAMEINMNATSIASGKGTAKIDLTYEDIKPSLDLYYDLVDAEAPQLFFKVDGVDQILQAFSAPYSQDSVKMDGQWWLIDFKELVDKGIITQEELNEYMGAKGEQLTADDLSKLSAAFITVSNKYIFTQEVDNMVLQQTGDLGMEVYEGVDCRKYSVVVNKTNLKRYMKELRDTVEATGVVKKFSPDLNLKEDITDEEIDKSVDETKFEETKITAWVDAENKILRNIRLEPTKEEDGKGYVDTSLLLNDANLDTIPLRLKAALEDSEAKFNMTLNWTTNTTAKTTEITFDADYDFLDEASSDVGFTGNLTLRGLNEEPALEKPTNPKSVLQLMENTMPQTIEDSFDPGSIQPVLTT